MDELDEEGDGSVYGYSTNMVAPTQDTMAFAPPTLESTIKHNKTLTTPYDLTLNDYGHGPFTDTSPMQDLK